MTAIVTQSCHMLPFSEMRTKMTLMCRKKMCCLFDLMWLQMDLATVRFSTSHQESNIWCTGGDQSEAKRCSNINQQGNLTQTNTSNSQNTFPSLSLQDLIKSTYEYVAQGPFLTHRKLKYIPGYTALTGDRCLGFVRWRTEHPVIFAQVIQHLSNVLFCQSLSGTKL